MNNNIEALKEVLGKIVNIGDQISSLVDSVSKTVDASFRMKELVDKIKKGREVDELDSLLGHFPWGPTLIGVRLKEYLETQDETALDGAMHSATEYIEHLNCYAEQFQSDGSTYLDVGDYIEVTKLLTIFHDSAKTIASLSFPLSEAEIELVEKISDRIDETLKDYAALNIYLYW